MNKVILMGRLTRDPSLTCTSSNTPVCEFGLAVNRRWKDKDGNPKEDVMFVEITSFGRQAEVLNQYMKKGSPLLLEGRLRHQTWEKDGKRHHRHDVVLESFTFVGSRDKPDEDRSGSPDGPPGDTGATAPDDIPF